MIINGYSVKKDFNGHIYIELVSHDCYDEISWGKYWYNLILSINEMIPNYWLLHIDKILGEINYGYLEIDTLYGKIKIDTIGSSITEDVIGLIIAEDNAYVIGLIAVDDNSELIAKIIILLGKSNYFSAMD